MIRPAFGPGMQMRQSRRPAVMCRVCEFPIEKPGPLQKVHAGKCHREWTRRNMDRFKARKKLAAARKADRKRIGAIKGNKPERDPKYRAWIRSLACLACFWAAEGWEYWSKIEKPNTPRPIQTTPTEAAHTGPHAMSQKASDRTCIPLCKEHHTEGRDSYHKLGEKKFQPSHGIIIHKIVRALNSRYEQERAA